MKVQAEVLFRRLDLRLTGCESHSLNVAGRMLEVSVLVRGIERVVERQVEIRLDLLLLWLYRSILGHGFFRHLTNLLKGALSIIGRQVFGDLLLLGKLKFLLNI